MNLSVTDQLNIVQEAVSNNKVTPIEANQLVDGIRFLYYKSNILEWGKYYFESKFYKPFCYELHNYLISIRNHGFTSTLAPREHAKTIIKCFLVPIYQALNEPHEYLHYLNIQNTTTKAITVNLSIRHEFENNEKLIADYGNMVDTEKWTEKQFVLKNGIIFSAVGAGESVRGLNYLNIRPDYILGDDIYDEDDIYQLSRIQKKRRWWWGTIYPMRASHKKTSIHLQGTAINRQDLLHELANKKGVKFRKFKAVVDFDKKKTLWMPFKQLMEDKELMGSVIFAREFQNECRDDESSIIKESWIKYYNGTLPSDQKVVQLIGACDPAIGQKKTSDFTGKVLVLKTDLNNYYVQELKNERMSFQANATDIDNWHQRIKFNIFKVEAISAFKGLCELIRSISAVPLKEISSVKDKVSRKEAQSAKFENGKVFINKEIPLQLRNELVEQLINNKPTHDDLSDALILALEDHTRELYFSVI